MTLAGLPWSEKLMQAYTAAMARESVLAKIDIGAPRSKPGSVGAAVAGYLGSGQFSSLAETTKEARRRTLERFRTQHGDKGIAGIERRHVETWVSNKAAKSPGSALLLLVSLRELMKHAVRIGMRADDPTQEVRRPRLKDEGLYPWSEDDIGKFEAMHPIGTRARLAMALALYTGQRRSDIIKMGRQHVRNDTIQVRQQKTGIILNIPLHPELQAIIEATPNENLTFLTTQYSRPFSPKGFGKWFKDEVRKAGLPPRANVHGLRKAAARRLAEAGCSASIIASITGHQSLREVAQYTASAEQLVLARQGIAALVEKTAAKSKRVRKADANTAGGDGT